MTTRSARQSRLYRTVGINFLLVLTAPILNPYLIAKANATEPAEQQPADWSIGLGVGALYVPDYEGSDDYEFQPFPVLSLNYKDIVFVEGPEIGVNLLNLDLGADAKLKIGPLARYRQDRDPKDNSDLRGLGKVGISAEIGGFVRLEYDIWSFRLSGGKDVAGGHDGIVAEAEIGASYALTDTLSANFAATAGWADRKYMTSFFTVTPLQATRSGLPQFRAGSGIKDAGAHLALNYSLNSHWMITGAGGYKKLLGDAADSPVVAIRGSDDQFFGGLFLSYRF